MNIDTYTSNIAAEAKGMLPLLQEAMKVPGLLDNMPSMPSDSLWGFKRLDADRMFIITISGTVVMPDGELMGWPKTTPEDSNVGRNMSQNMDPIAIMRSVDYKSSAIMYEAAHPGTAEKTCEQMKAYAEKLYEYIECSVGA